MIDIDDVPSDLMPLNASTIYNMVRRANRVIMRI
jgi:hypothetical protein